MCLHNRAHNAHPCSHLSARARMHAHTCAHTRIRPCPTTPPLLSPGLPRGVRGGERVCLPSVGPASSQPRRGRHRCHAGQMGAGALLCVGGHPPDTRGLWGGGGGCVTSAPSLARPLPGPGAWLQQPQCPPSPSHPRGRAAPSGLRAEACVFQGHPDPSEEAPGLCQPHAGRRAGCRSRAQQDQSTSGGRSKGCPFLPLARTPVLRPGWCTAYVLPSASRCPSLVQGGWGGGSRAQGSPLRARPVSSCDGWDAPGAGLSQRPPGTQTSTWGAPPIPGGQGWRGRASPFTSSSVGL